MSDWRADVIAAVDEVVKRLGSANTGKWRSLGIAAPSSQPGWYTRDMRAGIPGSADHLDQLCFASSKGPEHSMPIPVERSLIVDDVLHVQIVGALPAGCDTLWTVQLTKQHLWRKLREGIASVSTAPLADKLAAGALDHLSQPDQPDYPPGFLSNQQQAYRACVEPGIHAVWGPPGTGKTRVLARAIEDLVKKGKSVLLVSTANVAVDNALQAVINTLAPTPGTVVRAGNPHVPELARNDDVQLHRLAARATAKVDKQRQDVQETLADLDQADDQLTALNEALRGYNHHAFLTAQQRMTRRVQLGAKQGELRCAEDTHQQVGAALATAQTTYNVAATEQSRIQPQRENLEKATELSRRLDALIRDLQTKRADFTTQEFEASQAGLLTKPAAKWALNKARKRLHQLEAHVTGQRAELERLIKAYQQAAHPVTEEYAEAVARQAHQTRQQLEAAQARETQAQRQLAVIRKDCAQLERLGVATEADMDLVTSCKRRDLPRKHARREEVIALQGKQQRQRSALEEKLRDLNRRSESLRKDAEGHIVADAKVVATTLARSYANPAIARKHFDVVLVDEAGAARLGDVLFAVSRARRTAALLGDFLQLGPIAHELPDKPVVKKWLAPQPFEHCGIHSAADVSDHPGCIGLIHQFRFGPNLRQLANDVAYRVLQDGATAAGGREPDNTEIVLVDVSGLDDLNRVHRSRTYTGWWPVGALLSRSLAQYHAADAGGVGVVTTFRPQAEATLAAFRDADQNLSVAVGTAHSFQGREFDSVVFDLVEDGNGWISKAQWHGGAFVRDGVRVFGVGITRARKRLYVIVNQHAVKGAQGNTPLGALWKRVLNEEVQVCRASVLLGMADERGQAPASPVEAELNEVLRGLVDVTEIHDEFSFDAALHEHISAADRSLWMWSPWVGNKSQKFLPLIRDAVERGVDVRVFVRTESDRIMRQEAHKRWVAELRNTGATVIRAQLEHRKIVVADRQIVLLGSQNPLSQRSSREVMIACQGAAFAERVLGELDAERIGNPPVCCDQLCDLHRSEARRKGMPYFWRCRQCKQDRALEALRVARR